MRKTPKCSTRVRRSLLQETDGASHTVFLELNNSLGTDNFEMYPTLGATRPIITAGTLGTESSRGSKGLE